MSRRPEKSLVGPPNAISFLRISQLGILQQPQALALRTRSDGQEMPSLELLLQRALRRAEELSDDVSAIEGTF